MQLESGISRLLSVEKCSLQFLKCVLTMKRSDETVMSEVTQALLQ